MIKVVSIVGARPQFVKAAVLRKAFEAAQETTEILVHTGQHFDKNMSDVFFKDLEIRPPEYFLDIHGGSHGTMTGRMMEQIDLVLDKEKPDACLVYGDTNSTLAGALCAAKMHIPVIHVEAGLRSFNKKMPEELNRITTDHLSDLLYCSTYESITNLKNENIHQGVKHVGDIMFDAVQFMKTRISNIAQVQGVDLATDNIALCTLHRAENTDDKARLQEIIEYLKRHTETYQIVIPLHPRTKNAAEKYSISLDDFTVIDPVGYSEMQALLGASNLVFTDSGGLQKEAYFHGIKCVTLREETEWVELITHGWNRLWREKSYAPQKDISEYGIGNTGDLIVSDIISHFSR